MLEVFPEAVTGSYTNLSLDTCHLYLSASTLTYLNQTQ